MSQGVQCGFDPTLVMVAKLFTLNFLPTKDGVTRHTHTHTQKKKKKKNEKQKNDACPTVLVSGRPQNQTTDFPCLRRLEGPPFWVLKGNHEERHHLGQSDTRRTVAPPFSTGALGRGDLAPRLPGLLNLPGLRAAEGEGLGRARGAPRQDGVAGAQRLGRPRQGQVLLFSLLCVCLWVILFPS